MENTIIQMLSNISILTRYVGDLDEQAILAKIRNKKNKCKRLGIDFNISEKELIAIYKGGHCFYTSKKLLTTEASLDRINPELGYISNNVVLCDKELNARKSNLTCRQMQLILAAIKNLR